jgi:dTDP-4-amino-4,6-dideoxygalactose transaminase
MLMIPVFSAHAFEDISRVAKVLHSGVLSERTMVEQFRGELQRLFGHEHVVPLNSCTSAITLALRLLGVGPGDEVVSTPFTMIATNCAIAALGAKIVWCDVDPATFSADMKSVYARITPATKAAVLTCVGGVTPDHLDGYPPDAPPLVIDGAHSFMTSYRGTHISHWGDYTCFSFQSIKHLTTGDGGALAVNSRRLAGVDPSWFPGIAPVEQNYLRADRMKWFGISRTAPPGMSRLEHQMKSDIVEFGYKFHMNDLAAALGLSCIDKALAAVQRSREHAAFYQRAFAGVPGLTRVVVPEGCAPAWWIYGMLAADADGLIEHCAAHGIETTRLWRRNDTYSCFRESAGTPLPGMDTVAGHAVFIPSGWWVTDSDRDTIAEQVIRFQQHHAAS